MSRQSADTDTKANLTNVALKGIIGIQAMAEISTAMNISTDVQHYSVSIARLTYIIAIEHVPQSAAASRAAMWQQYAVSSDGQHILTSFGDSDDSEALTYNLFADQLLSTSLISPSVSVIVFYSPYR